MKEKISVCMASYNGERFIENQMASILCQLSEDDEVIVVDDKSTDGTIQILKNFNDDRIKINCNAQNMGANTSFQKALSLATGRYIFLSDQDDVWYENKVQICLKYLKEHNLDLMVHDARVINILKNSVISESLFAFAKITETSLSAVDVIVTAISAPFALNSFASLSLSVCILL